MARSELGAYLRTRRSQVSSGDANLPGGGLRLRQGARRPANPPGPRRAARRQPAFARLWSSHDARGKTLETRHFRHRDVGPLTLAMQAFDVRSSPGQDLVVYHAEPGTSSAEALALLGSLAASATRPA